MNKAALGVLVVLAMQSCSGPDKESNKHAAVEAPVKASKNAAAFNQSFEQLLTTYYSLKEAFVDYDTVKINSVSKALSTNAGGLRMDEFKNDPSGAVKATVADYTGTIKSAAGAIAVQNEFQKKQRQFQTISDAMYELVRAVKYDRQKIYHQHCPMAFDNEGAYWISSSNEIVNPYMGKKHPKYRSAMLECGDIPDSLDFSK